MRNYVVGVWNVLNGFLYIVIKSIILVRMVNGYIMVKNELDIKKIVFRFG